MNETTDNHTDLSTSNVNIKSAKATVTPLRNEQINIRVTSDERRLLQSRAGEANVSLSQFCRDAAFNAPIVDPINTKTAGFLAELQGHGNNL